MANNPITPNYVPGVGQLTTYRSDFESHIQGTNFRHVADQIDLGSNNTPVPITIAGTPCHNVEQAIITLNANLAPAPPRATIGSSTSNLGLITLGGDLSGNGSTALIPRVGAIQGRAIANLSPTSGQLLAWSGTAWTPTTFALVGDVTGAYNANKVTSITSSTTVNINANCLLEFATLTVANGAAIVVNSPGQININAAGAFNLAAANDFVQYGTPHTRTIWNTFTVLNSTLFAAGWAGSSSLSQPYAQQSTNVSGNYPIIFKIDNLHNGATLESLTICFVTTPHTSLPQYLPAVSVYRVQLETNSINNVVFGYTGGSPTPVDYIHYNNSGNPQQFTAIFTSNNLIDTSNYIYYAILFDESGTNSLVGNTYYGYSVGYGSITSDQFP